MNILIIITQPFDPTGGGVQMSTFKLSTFFRKKGYNTTVFSFACEKHDNYGDIPLTFASAYGGYKNELNQSEFKKHVFDLNPDVVINQMPYEFVIGEILGELKKQLGFYLLACLRNSLFSVKLNLIEYIKNALPPLFSQFSKLNAIQSLFLKIHKHRHSSQLKRILNIYDKFVMFGEPNFDELRYFVGDYKMDKWQLIPNSIPDVLKTVPHKQKTLLYVGRLSIKQKRSDLLLPLWKKVCAKLPDWNFVIVGDGPYMKQIEHDIVSQDIKNVELKGKQPSFPYYEKASFVVMVSSFEGFPNVLVEAQSRACIPFVMDTYPIASWLLNNEIDGYLVQPFNLDDMAGKIIRTAKSEQLSNKMANAALSNAEKYVINVVGEKWIKLLDEKNNFLSHGNY